MKILIKDSTPIAFLIQLIYHVWIFFQGKIAYVPQQAWIQNATLRDNILFGRPMVDSVYKRVLEACSLIADIKMLPGGDMIEIGEKVISHLLIIGISHMFAICKRCFI